MGANVRAREETLWTPLHLAAQTGGDAGAEIARSLLANGADVDARTNRKTTSLHLAAQSGDNPFIEILLAANADIEASTSSELTPICSAAVNGHIDTIDLLWEHGAIVDIRDEDGWNLLHLACHMTDNVELIEKLISIGVSMDGLTNRRQTPLCVAIQAEHFEVFEALLKHGAKTDLED
ncbi:ankyrin [Trematosphaeria pertusa]|uniref:Ankyrin n=1 Tax=Trematosphaeria pertusa TaxID=390896 RepID=A0A6A6I5U3_9PLEO|nr:ankyrin [Trematosphaeria pertusa]KAF2245895.1 ankyrin [Trematosphaeria pertusa]